MKVHRFKDFHSLPERASLPQGQPFAMQSCPPAAVNAGWFDPRFNDRNAGGKTMKGSSARPRSVTSTARRTKSVNSLAQRRSPGCQLRSWAAALCIAALPPLLIGSAAQAADRPPVMGPTAAVSAGDPLTTAAAFEILLAGGNAFDAGVASLLVGGVIEQDLYSLGGEALVLVYPQNEGKVTSVVGQGWASKNATIEWYRSRGKDLSGEGLDPSVIPGALHAALTVLERWGTMSFEQVSARAIQ
jgi:hypothetical protein